MPQIHPTAIVDDLAQLADDVIVGPGCIISSGVKVGAATRLTHRVTLKGPLTVGIHNIFYPNSCIGFAPQDLSYDAESAGAGTVVGSHNVIREGVTIHRATKDKPTTVGDRNYLMANSHVGHDSVIHNDVVMVNGALLGGHVEIADKVILGGNAVVHQFCRAGRMAMISGLRGITKDLPPFCVCYDSRTTGSLNLVGLRRAGLRDHIPSLKKAFDIVFCQGHTRLIAADLVMENLADDPLCVEFANFVRNSKRGIVKYKARSDDADE